jgi:Domain of unknown function (DUF4430)
MEEGAKNKTIEVTITIDFGPVDRAGTEKSVTVSEKSTVLDALNVAADLVTSPKFGMDHFVEEIDGIRNDFASDRGWRFEVNGHRSNVPAERYLVKRGDWVKWLYLEGACK